MFHSLRRGTVAAGWLFLVTAVAGVIPAAYAQSQKVVGVEVKGNTRISTDVILSATRTKIGADFSEQAMTEDERAIRRLGFFHEVRAQSQPAAGGVTAVFSVVEHPVVTAIEITGNTKVSTEKLRSLLLTQVGSVFNETTFEKDVNAVQKTYREQGYMLARVTEKYGVSPEGVVRIPIAEGWIEQIKVIGNKKTKTRIILREMDTKPGDVFDSRKLQEDLQRLRNLDYFEMLGFEPAEGSEPGKVNLVVNCKEKKTGTVSVGLGYSSRERLVGFADVSENNFRGVGQRLGVRWEAGQYTNRSGYEFSFNDPWMLGKRTSLGFEIYNRTTNRPLVLGGNIEDTWVDERRKGFGLSVGKPVGRKTRVLLDLRSDDVGYAAIDGYPAPAQEVLQSDGRINSSTLRIIHNTRDLDINPHRGALHSASVETAGGPLGGKWSYSKLGTDLRYYFPIGGAKPDGSNQKVLATRLMGGMSLGNPPLSENYWIGGAESLRGYREDQFHGTRVLLMSAELRIPFGTSLQGVTFFDCGYAWPDQVGMKLSDMQSAVGIGLRVVTPLGPLRLDYGFGKEGGRSHFSIGHVF